MLFTLHRSDCGSTDWCSLWNTNRAFASWSKSNHLHLRASKTTGKVVDFPWTLTPLFDFGSSSHWAGGWEELLQRCNWPWASLLRAVMKRSSPNARRGSSGENAGVCICKSLCHKLLADVWLNRFSGLTACFEFLSEQLLVEKSSAKVQIMKQWVIVLYSSIWFEAFPFYHAIQV